MGLLNFLIQTFNTKHRVCTDKCIEEMICNKVLDDTINRWDGYNFNNRSGNRSGGIGKSSKKFSIKKHMFKLFILTRNQSDCISLKIESILLNRYILQKLNNRYNSR